MTKLADELWEKNGNKIDGYIFIGKRGFTAALTEAMQAVRKRDAEVARKRAETRWEEFGVTESDTNASYYPAAIENEMGIRDMEDEDCAAAIEREPLP